MPKGRKVPFWVLNGEFSARMSNTTRSKEVEIKRGEEEKTVHWAQRQLSTLKSKPPKSSGARVDLGGGKKSQKREDKK